MDKRIIEGIEVCRPGSDDVLAADLSHVAHNLQRDSEARVFYDRVQKWDANMADAMEQVLVPEGLAQRILDRLRAAALASDSRPSLHTLENVMAGDPQATVVPVDLSLQHSRRSLRNWSRRRWLSVGSTIAAGLLVTALLSVVLQPRQSSPLEAMADTWLQNLGPTWQAVAAVPREFPMPGAIVVPPAGWQRVGTLSTARGVVYKLVRGNASTAMLFAVKLSAKGLPSTPPAEPQSTTGGKAVGYWQSGGLVYVLVVDGDERTYRNFIRSSATPLA